MNWLEVLQIVGAIALALGGLCLLILLGWFQATWDMTEEEKKRLADDIAKNGLFFRKDVDPWDF